MTEKSLRFMSNDQKIHQDPPRTPDERISRDISVIPEKMEKKKEGVFPEVKGSYEYETDIVKKLGEGGMGSVYLAKEWWTGRKEEEERREVVIKIVQDEYLQKNPLARQLFAQEIRALGKAGGNPHVVKMFYPVETNRGPGIAMEYMNGGDLGDMIAEYRGRPMDERVACEVARQICVALEEIHAQGFVHRDLKPGNVLAGEGGFFKVTDFGVAHAIEKTIDEMSETEVLALLERRAEKREVQNPALTGIYKTQAGAVVGSPLYMSPESVETGKIDQRADLYSLGVILYEMMSGGRVPFEEEKSPLLIMSAKTRFQPVPIDIVVQRKVSTLLDSIVMQLLERDPDKRSKLVLPNGSEISLATAADVKKAITDYAESAGFGYNGVILGVKFPQRKEPAGEEKIKTPSRKQLEEAPTVDLDLQNIKEDENQIAV